MASEDVGSPTGSALDALFDPSAARVRDVSAGHVLQREEVMRQAALRLFDGVGEEQREALAPLVNSAPVPRVGAAIMLPACQAPVHEVLAALRSGDAVGERLAAVAASKGIPLKVCDQGVVQRGMASGTLGQCGHGAVEPRGLVVDVTAGCFRNSMPRWPAVRLTESSRYSLSVDSDRDGPPCDGVATLPMVEPSSPIHTDTEISMIQPNRRTVLATLACAAVLPAGVGLAQQAPSPFMLDPLPYPASQNEPHIDAETMTLHHDRHHAAYVANLNAAAAKHGELGRTPLPEILANLGAVPEDVRAAVRNNGGGHANHTMFWQVMGGRGGEPVGDLQTAIERDFGGLAKLRENFDAAGTRIFGSGWVFVTVSRDGTLALTTRPNQDTPLMDGQRVLIGNDVWEHAYYLTYRNRRPDYLKAWWNVVDWGKVAERYAAARAGTLGV